MSRLLIKSLRTAILLAVLAVPAAAQFRNGTLRNGELRSTFTNAPVIVGACDTTTDSAIFDDTAAGAYTTMLIAGSSYGSPYTGTQFTTSASKVITELRLWCWDDGTDFGSIIAQIYTDSANTIGSAIAGTSATVAGTSIPNGVANGAVVNFTLASTYTLSAGTYWLVFKSTGHNDALFQTRSQFSGSTRRYFDGSAVQTDGYLRAALYGCDP